MDNPTRKQLGFQTTESVNEISSVLPRYIVSDNISWSTISDIPLGTNQTNTNTKISGQSSKLPDPVSENRKIHPLVRHLGEVNLIYHWGHPRSTCR